MIRRNNQTNRLIMWLVVVGDFVLLNLVLLFFALEFLKVEAWNWENKRLFFFICNVALLVSEWKFHTTIHERMVSAGKVVKVVMLLTVTQTLIAYLLMRHLMYWTSSGRMLVMIYTVYFCVVILARLVERSLVKYFRKMGRNTRRVTLVGADVELVGIYRQMLLDPTMGYRVLGYYADKKCDKYQMPWLGTVQSLLEDIDQGHEKDLGDELYVCMSRKRGDVIRQLSAYCDSQVTKFYYVPISVDSIGLNLHREYINDIEVFTTHVSPLQKPVNAALKRFVDIVIAIIALLITVLLLPFVILMMKLQSPGPLLFKQLRTGMDGKNFMCYKFRSMHVNKDADRVQASKDDPRKYPFGNLMRKTNIDELPQFWNVLKGDMSVVGPRPHMLAHTKMYSKLIGQYMVRHFVKPGVTGWAQVTGFRGETKKLWQMEGRVERDIWYMEHWSIWLDIRIIWMTIKTCFVHDKNAY